MRVLLVTLTDMLPFVLTQVLNPALEYCAVVVEESDLAKRRLVNVPPLREKIYPLYELKECIAENYFNVAICAFPFWNEMSKEFKKYGLPKNKLISLTEIHTNGNFLLEKSLRYYGQNLLDFEMFATGASRVQFGLVPKQFKRKLFNFGNSSQDLYFDYQIARRILTKRGGRKIALLNMR